MTRSKYTLTILFLIFMTVGCAAVSEQSAINSSDNQPTTVQTPTQQTPITGTATTEPTTPAVNEPTSTTPTTTGPTSTGPTSTTPATPVEPDQVKASLDRYVIDAKKHPKALCNDGTTPVFYFRKGVGSGAKKWVIYFKGGGACFDKESCADRELSLTSAKAWTKKTLVTDGILSANSLKNPDFYNWNHVHMVYCSSDSWSGTRLASKESGNWNFTGHHIVNAILDGLQTDAAIGTENLTLATHVILTGSSAGANGLRNNVDRLTKMLSFAEVKAFSDAAFVPKELPDASERLDSAMTTRETVWQPVYDESCKAQHIDEPWLCGNGSYLLVNGHISTPIFIHMDQRDFKLNTHVSQDPKIGKQEKEVLGANIRDALSNVTGAFSPRWGFHVIATSDRFYSKTIDGISCATVFGNWYFDREGPKNVVEQP